MAEKILIADVAIENFLIFIFVFIFTLIGANLIYTLLRRVLDEKIAVRNSKLLSRIGQYIVIALGTYYGIYYVLGLNLTALAASLGIIGIAIALSSQQIIQNVIAGILVSIQRQIQLEDWVQVGGVPDTGICKVKDITLSNIVLRDTEGKIVYIPSSLLLSTKIINYTKAGFIEVPVQITIPYGPDHEKVKNVILDVANNIKTILAPDVKKEDRSTIIDILRLPRFKWLFKNSVNVSMFKPKVLISDISNSEITFSARFWTTEIQKKDEIVSEFLSVLLERFKKEKIQF